MIGILTAASNPFTSYYCNSIDPKYLSSIGLIIDSKEISSRDIEIIHDRTANLFKKTTDQISPLLNDFGFVLKNTPHLCSKLNSFVSSNNIKVLISIGTPRKISKELIDAIPQGIINIHPGYLPHFRGCSAVEWSLLEGFPITNTLHYMSEDYDSGDIIGIYRVNINPLDDYWQIRQKVHLHSFKIFS